MSWTHLSATRKSGNHHSCLDCRAKRMAMASFSWRLGHQSSLWVQDHSLGRFKEPAIWTWPGLPPEAFASRVTSQEGTFKNMLLSRWESLLLGQKANEEGRKEGKKNSSKEAKKTNKTNTFHHLPRSTPPSSPVSLWDSSPPPDWVRPNKCRRSLTCRRPPPCAWV